MMHAGMVTDYVTHYNNAAPAQRHRLRRSQRQTRRPRHGNPGGPRSQAGRGSRTAAKQQRQAQHETRRLRPALPCRPGDRLRGGACGRSTSQPCCNCSASRPAKAAASSSAARAPCTAPLPAPAAASRSTSSSTPSTASSAAVAATPSTCGRPPAVKRLTTQLATYALGSTFRCSRWLRRATPTEKRNPWLPAPNLVQCNQREERFQPRHSLTRSSDPSRSGRTSTWAGHGVWRKGTQSAMA